MSNEQLSSPSPAAIGTTITEQPKPSFIPTVSQIDPRNIVRILQPLDGEEVIKAILAFVEKMLRNSGKFHEAQVYEEIVWRFRLDAQWAGYANTQVRMDTGGAAVVEEENKAKDIDEKDKVSDTMTLEGAQTKPDLAPDEIRELSGQPIPVLSTTGGSKVVRVDSSKLKRR